MNLYPEVSIAPGAKPKKQVVYYPTPGLTRWASVGPGPIRGEFYQDGRFFVVSGANFYEVFAGGSSTLYGAVAASSLPVTMATNGTGGHQLFITSGTKGYIFDLTANTLTLIADADFPAAVVMGDFSDGYFLALPLNSISFQFSSLEDGTAWSATDIGTKQQTSDNIRALIVNHKEVWLLGSKTTEVWYNSGDLQSTFAPIQGVLIEHGIGPIYSLVKANNTLCWIGQDSNGIGQAWMAQGYTPVRFSTHAVEQAWATYSTLEDAIAWSYQDRGHTFYEVTFPTANHTWVYDFASEMWHERGLWDAKTAQYDAVLERTHAFAFGRHLVGSRVDGTIYEQSSTVYTDAGTPIRRMRRAPILSVGQNRVLYRRAQLDLQSGVGLSTGQGSAPQVMLRWSNDSGQTWSNEYWASAGLLGNYAARVLWRRLGMGRNRVFEAAMSDPIQAVWIDLLIDATPGVN
jgi:hypothetical protein